MGANIFSLIRDYTCSADPIVPDFSFFDQVHNDTGYASNDTDVQGDAGMDDTAILLANRTDCGYDSELNFDALLLGGYFCHVCLPDNPTAGCGGGGICSNVQWDGYLCDNEFTSQSRALVQLAARVDDMVESYAKTMKSEGCLERLSCHAGQITSRLGKFTRPVVEFLEPMIPSYMYNKLTAFKRGARSGTADCSDFKCKLPFFNN